ncbi:type II toxin-antitoxin system VapC family toxin [Nocardia pneumoniae]|uniref:type II toxin-antitoxin system VapC family toxin n=1 Tax=Nocardia pneumoniae TaxID=228601 RepID=UPI0002E84AE6|nr:type II toxin-antitoxin system VapC family toxin [Nocardia pneumoniae]
MIVLETSALIELLTDQRSLRHSVAARLLAEEAMGEKPYAPALIDAEAAKVLRRLSRKELPNERATAAIDEMAAMDMVRCTFEHLLPRVWELRHNMYPFDAVYAALAEDLGAPLVTSDMKFEPLAVSGIIRCSVETLTPSADRVRQLDN